MSECRGPRPPDLLVIAMAGVGVTILIGLLIIRLVPYLITIGGLGLAAKIMLSLRRIEQLRGRMINLRRRFAERQERYQRAQAAADRLSDRDRRLAADRLAQLRQEGRELIDQLRILMDEIGAVKKEILAKLGDTSDAAIARRLAPFSEVEAEIEQLIAQIGATFAD